jgi:ABC-type multidrug transport system permease subunit
MVTLAGIIGVSLVVASLCARTFLFLTAGNIPLFLLMFLTGAMFPLARNPFVEFAGIGIAWNDLLPPTLAVVALQKVMTQGAGLAEIIPHLIALTVVAALWLSGGTLLFRRMHLRTR